MTDRMSNSALLILAESDKVPNMDESSISIAKETARISKDFVAGLTIPVGYVSPFMPHTMYRASVIYMEMTQEVQSEASTQALLALKQALRVLEARWKVAGTY